MADDQRGWAPSDIDLNTATLARIYDFMLGGAHNFAVDREFAERIEATVPGSARTAWANRAFLRRAVQYCAARGIDQFLDIGSGIPTEGNVHEVARAVNPRARVVYVDLDPVAMMQSRAILADDELAGVVNADLRDPEAILADPDTQRLIDFDRPVAVLLVAILHVIPDADRPSELLARLTAPTAPGSHLVITHFSTNYGTADEVRSLLELSRDTTTPMVVRDPTEIRALFGEFVPVEPGVVPIHEWRPDPDSSPGEAQSSGYAGVARTGDA